MGRVRIECSGTENTSVNKASYVTIESYRLLKVYETSRFMQTSTGCQNYAMWVKILQNSYFIIFKIGKSVGKHLTSTHQKMAANNENVLIRLLL